MARSRIIKPEFFKHAELYDAEQATGFPLRTAFAGLWCQTDREGRFAWKPRELKLDVLPHDALDFGEVLDALERFGFVESYEVAGKRYGLIPTFKDHQTFHVKEGPSRLPPPPAGPPPGSHQARTVPPETPREATPPRLATPKTSTTAPDKPGASAVQAPGGDGSSTPVSVAVTASISASVGDPSNHPAQAEPLMNRFPLTGGARSALVEFLEAVPDGTVSQWEAVINGCLDGIGCAGMRPAPANAVAAAMLDMLAKKAALEPTLFRRFVDRAVRESARPIATTGRPSAEPASPLILDHAGEVFDKILTMGESLPGGLSFSLRAIEERFGPSAKRAVKEIGGSNALANMRGADQRFLRDRFVKAYAAALPQSEVA